ncbi:unnamed protein product, partial [marine sediment metagenome]
MMFIKIHVLEARPYWGYSHTVVVPISSLKLR